MAQPAAATAQRSLTSTDIRNHYDQFAWAYRRYWGDHIHHGLFLRGDEDSEHAQEMMLRECARRAGVARGMNVADVGCGHGGTARFLATEYGCHVLGITISEAQVKHCRELSQSLPGSGSVRFELANAEDYPFPRSAFDLIWNMESSEHFFDKPAYFRKVAEALKPGGRLVVAAWTGSMEQHLIREIAKAFLCPGLLTADQYAEAIEGAGLKMVSCTQLAAEVAPTWEISSKRVRNASWMLAFLPASFREFTQGVELMRQGYRCGWLTYSIQVAEK